MRMHVRTLCGASLISRAREVDHAVRMLRPAALVFIAEPLSLVARACAAECCEFSSCTPGAEGRVCQTRRGGSHTNGRPRREGHAAPGAVVWLTVCVPVGRVVCESFRNSDSSRRAVGVARRWGPHRYGLFGPAGGRVPGAVWKDRFFDAARGRAAARRRPAAARRPRVAAVRQGECEER